MEMNKKKVLVTGGAGFVGSNLVLKLTELMSDYDITVLDNYFTGTVHNTLELRRRGVKCIEGNTWDVLEKKS